MQTNQARAEMFVWIVGLLVVSLMFYNASVYRQWDKPRRKEVVIVDVDDN